MKSEVSKLVKILGITYSEIIVDIDLKWSIINTIEVRDEDVILHVFPDDELDIEFSFDDIPEEDQKFILQFLRKYAYN